MNARSRAVLAVAGLGGLVTRVIQGRLGTWEVTDLQRGSTTATPQLPDEAILGTVLLK